VIVERKSSHREIPSERWPIYRPTSIAVRKRKVVVRLLLFHQV